MISLRRASRRGDIGGEGGDFERKRLALGEGAEVTKNEDADTEAGRDLFTERDTTSKMMDDTPTAMAAAKNGTRRKRLFVGDCVEFCPAYKKKKAEAMKIQPPIGSMKEKAAPGSSQSTGTASTHSIVSASSLSNDGRPTHGKMDSMSSASLASLASKAMSDEQPKKKGRRSRPLFKRKLRVKLGLTSNEDSLPTTTSLENAVDPEQPAAVEEDKPADSLPDGEDLNSCVVKANDNASVPSLLDEPGPEVPPMADKELSGMQPGRNMLPGSESASAEPKLHSNNNDSGAPSKSDAVESMELDALLNSADSETHDNTNDRTEARHPSTSDISHSTEISSWSMNSSSNCIANPLQDKAPHSKSNPQCDGSRPLDDAAPRRFSSSDASQSTQISSWSMTSSSNVGMKQSEGAKSSSTYVANESVGATASDRAHRRSASDASQSSRNTHTSSWSASPGIAPERPQKDDSRITAQELLSLAKQRIVHAQSNLTLSQLKQQAREKARAKSSKKRVQPKRKKRKAKYGTRKRKVPPPSEEEEEAVQEAVEIVEMETGLLYLYRGENRRAEFVRRRG